MRTGAGGQSWPSTARPEDGLSPRLAGRWTRPKPRTRASTPREGDVRSGGGSQHRDLGPAPAGRLEARVVEHVGVEVGAVRPGLGGPDPRQDDDLPPPSSRMTTRTHPWPSIATPSASRSATTSHTAGCAGSRSAPHQPSTSIVLAPPAVAPSSPTPSAAPSSSYP